MVDLAAFTKMFGGLVQTMNQINSTLASLVDLNERSLSVLNIMRAQTDQDRFDKLEESREVGNIFVDMNKNLEKILTVLTEANQQRQNRGDLSSWAVFFGTLKTWAVTHLSKVLAFVLAPFKAISKVMIGSVAVLTKTIGGFGKLLKTPLSLLGAGAMGFGAKIGQMGATGVKAIGGGLAGVANMFKLPNILPGSIAPVAGKIGGIVSTVGKFTGGALVTAISGTATFVKTTFSFLKSLSPLGKIFTGLVSSVGSVVKVFTGTVSKVVGLFGRFGSVVGRIALPLMAILAAFEIVPKVLQKVASGDIVGALDEAVQGIYKFFVEDLVNIVSNFFRNNLEMPAVADFLDSTSSLFKSVIGDATEGTGLLGAITKMFTGDFWGGVATLGDTVAALFDGIGSIMRDYVIPGIGSIITSMWESLTWDNIKEVAGGLAGLAGSVVNGLVRMVGKIFGWTDEEAASFDIKEIVKATARKIVGIWDMMVEGVKDLIRMLPGGTLLLGEDPEELKKITPDQIQRDMEEAAKNSDGYLWDTDPNMARAEVYEEYKKRFEAAGVPMPEMAIPESVGKALQYRATPNTLEVNPGFGEFYIPPEEMVQPTPPALNELLAPGTKVVPDAPSIGPQSSVKSPLPMTPTGYVSRTDNLNPRPILPPSTSSSGGNMVVVNEGAKTTIVNGGSAGGGGGNGGSRPTTPIYEREQYMWRQFTSQ